MWFKLSSYLSFLVTSVNQHGVHSPFVYQLVTKCLYAKKLSASISSPSFLQNTNKKQDTILQKLNRYFLPKTWKNATSKKQFNSYDFILFEVPNVEVFKNQIPLATNNSVFIVKNIYQNKKANQHWNKIINLNKVTVSIDTFYLGIVFFRKEQAKQHFTIRV